MDDVLGVELLLLGEVRGEILYSFLVLDSREYRLVKLGVCVMFTSS